MMGVFIICGPPCFLRQSFTLNPETPNSARLTGKLHRSAHLSLLSAGIMDTMTPRFLFGG